MLQKYVNIVTREKEGVSVKKVIIGLLVIVAIGAAFTVATRGKSTGAKDLKVVKKELVPSMSNKAIVKGVLKNEGKEDATIVNVKAVFKDEKGTGIDEAFVSLKNVPAGKETSFSIESYADFYKVTSYDVFVDSAQ